MLELQLWILIASLSAAVICGALLGLLLSAPKRKQMALELTHQQNQAEKSEAQLQLRLEQLEQDYQRALQQRNDLQAELAGTKARLEETSKNATEKQQLLESSEARLKQEFERLAQQIFEQKSQRLQDSSKQTLESTLAPFKQQLDSFKQQVQLQYSEEIKQRQALASELLGLKELNKQMSAEAEALTRALKGDTKQQGTWGEVVLERMLEQSGLREGHEYETQSQHRDDNGRAFKPDVIVHLPNHKDVVIDSKVSLTAYERYFNGDDDAEKTRALDEHVSSLRNHIKGLGKKNYQQLEGVRTLDYVLMFIPIEPAFLLAVDRDPELIKLALDNNIMLVSPTNLLVALRTVNNIWQYEYQSQNAQRIATDAGKLYDKFVGFLDDMQKMGNAIDSVKKNFDGAMNKLSTGRGNLVTRVDNFRKLGVQTNKRIDAKLLDEDEDERLEDQGNQDQSKSD